MFLEYVVDLAGWNCCDRGVGGFGVSVLWIPAGDSSGGFRGPMSGICGEGGCAAPAGADCFRPVVLGLTPQAVRCVAPTELGGRGRLGD